MSNKKITRRDFIKKSASCAIGAAGGIMASRFDGNAEAKDNIPDIVIADGAPGPATRKAVESMGGMSRYIKQGSKVVIKPNMSFPNPPSWGTTTHPDVIKEIVSMCLESGASNVKVLDNPLRNKDLCISRSGMKKIDGLFPKCTVKGVENRRFFREVSVPKGAVLKKTMIMNEVLDADVLIAAPVAKSHSATGVSLSMKGMMGLIYDRSEFHLDMDLNTAVVDLCTILKPVITIVDASRILTTGGPGGPGKVITMNKIIASADMVAADSMAVEIGTWHGKKFRANQVKHIKIAHERGVGRMDIDNLNVKKVTA